MFLLYTLLLPQAHATETRRLYDASGEPTEELIFDGDTRISETRWTYEGGQPVSQITTAGGVTTERRRTYIGGALTEETTLVDGQRVSRVTHDYEGGALVKTIETTPSSTRTTRYSYDSLGHLIGSETRDGAGAVIERAVSRYDPPEVPIVMTATGGGAYASDVRLTTLTGGFTVARSPDSARYAQDPLELRAGVSYAYGSAQGAVTQNQLDANFGLDLNHLIGRATYFLFTTLERDPVSNLSLDLLVAPAGLKYDLVDTAHVALDASFAPVWNYRAILSPGADCEGAAADQDFTCASSKLRGSLRVKLKLAAGPVELSDTVEYLPNLLPVGQSFAWALAEDSVATNTAGLGVKLSSTLTLSEAFVFQRDLTLAAQADCAADPSNLLCDGLLYTTSTTLAYSQSF